MIREGEILGQLLEDVLKVSLTDFCYFNYWGFTTTEWAIEAT